MPFKISWRDGLAPVKTRRAALLERNPPKKYNHLFLSSEIPAFPSSYRALIYDNGKHLSMQSLLRRN